MKKIILILNTFILLVLTSCSYQNTDNCHQVLTFVNNTNNHLYVSLSGEYPNNEAYKNEVNPLLDPPNSKIEALEKNNHVLSGKNCYEVTYRDYIKSGIMMVYVFDGSTLEAKGWDYIKANNLVLKRYDLTLEDLENMNWTIMYDGN